MTVLHQSTPKQVKPDLCYDSKLQWTTVRNLIIIIISSRRSSSASIYLCVLFIAVCFKNAKQYEQAKDAYLKEAEYHTENKTYPFCTLQLQQFLHQLKVLGCISSKCRKMSVFFFCSQLSPSGVTTAKHLIQSQLIFCILVSHNN